MRSLTFCTNGTFAQRRGYRCTRSRWQARTGPKQSRVSRAVVAVVTGQSEREAESRAGVMVVAAAAAAVAAAAAIVAGVSSLRENGWVRSGAGMKAGAGWSADAASFATAH